MLSRFLAIDSTGKTSSKSRAYCHAVGHGTNADVCVYAPGASLVKLMPEVLALPHLSRYRAGTIVSMANELDIPFSAWEQGKREHYTREFNIFATTMHAHKNRHHLCSRR